MYEAIEEMKVKTIKKVNNVIDTDLTDEEMEILGKADEILRIMQCQYGDKIELASVESDEVIAISELARVRGILGGLSMWKGWVMSIKK